MTYKDLARLVHPDLNPGMGLEKICMLNYWKNNPLMVNELAKKWGFMEKKRTISKTSKKENS